MVFWYCRKLSRDKDLIVISQYDTILTIPYGPYEDFKLNFCCQSSQNLRLRFLKLNDFPKTMFFKILFLTSPIQSIKPSFGHMIYALQVRTLISDALNSPPNHDKGLVWICDLILVLGVGCLISTKLRVRGCLRMVGFYSGKYGTFILIWSVNSRLIQIKRGPNDEMKTDHDLRWISRARI